MFLEGVIRFYKSLVEDKDFRSQLETASNSEECRKIMQEAGHDFTQEEFETATVEIIEKKGLRDLDDSLSKLSEEELELAFGGISYYWDRYKWFIGKEPIIQPLYGVVYQPPEEKPNPGFGLKHPIQPINPPEAVAMYGIVISDNLLL